MYKQLTSYENIYHTKTFDVDITETSLELWQCASCLRFFANQEDGPIHTMQK
jgi:hypothetical protein